MKDISGRAWPDVRTRAPECTAVRSWWKVPQDCSFQRYIPSPSSAHATAASSHKTNFNPTQASTSMLRETRLANGPPILLHRVRRTVVRRAAHRRINMLAALCRHDRRSPIGLRRIEEEQPSQAQPPDFRTLSPFSIPGLSGPGAPHVGRLGSAVLDSPGRFQARVSSDCCCVISSSLPIGPVSKSATRRPRHRSGTLPRS